MAMMLRRVVGTVPCRYNNIAALRRPSLIGRQGGGRSLASRGLFAGTGRPSPALGIIAARRRGVGSLGRALRAVRRRLSAREGADMSKRGWEKRCSARRGRRRISGLIGTRAGLVPGQVQCGEPTAVGPVPPTKRMLVMPARGGELVQVLRSCAWRGKSDRGGTGVRRWKPSSPCVLHRGTGPRGLEIPRCAAPAG